MLRSARDATGGRPVDVLWASPDCKHFSKAKGTAPKERNIRELAWAVARWVRDTRPKLVCVENVEEFQTWGPLDGDGQPIKSRAGETFRRWVREIEREGYRVDWRLLRACDYGAPTIRRRLFVVARRDRKPVRWPEPTHGPGLARPFRTAAECIDWSIPVPSIFERKRPLAENTLRRIAAGLKRYVIEAENPFVIDPDQAAWILQANTGVVGRPADEPMSTVCQSGSHQQLATAFLAKANHTADYYQCFRGQGMEEPLQTVTQSPGFSLVAATMVQTGYGERPGQAPRVPHLDKPMGTVVAGGGKHALVSAFLSQYYGASVGQDLQVPGPTLTVENKSGLVTAHLTHFYGSGAGEGDPGQPIKSITAGGLHAGLVYAFLTKHFGKSVCGGMDESFGTVTTKDRFGLVAVHVGGTPYVIVDIGLRMLTPRELARAQGFPDGYVIAPIHNGKPLSQKAQVAAIGNSVPPQFSEAVISANRDALDAPAQTKSKTKPAPLFGGVGVNV